jgi:hypothetical protein
MYERGRPMFGAQATSRTQSVCPSSVPSSIQACWSSLHVRTAEFLGETRNSVNETHLKPQIFTRLSHPALANLFIVV